MEDPPADGRARAQGGWQEQARQEGAEENGKEGYKAPLMLGDLFGIRQPFGHRRSADYSFRSVRIQSASRDVIHLGQFRPREILCFRLGREGFCHSRSVVLFWARHTEAVRNVPGVFYPLCHKGN
jgi:hypothetical protein